MDLSGVKIRQRLFYSKLKALTGSVLEIGFGYGLSFPYYTGASQITGVEMNERKIAFAGRMVVKHHLKNVRLIRVSNENLPFADHSFDAVTCSLVLCSVNNPQLLVEEIKRVLKPGGKVVLMEHQLLNHPLNHYIYNKLQVFRKHFTNCKLDMDQAALLRSHGFSIQETGSAKFLNQKVISLEN